MVTKTADLPFNAQHLDTWEKEGGVLIEDFFSPNEVQAVAADFARVFDNTITSDKPGKIPAKATSPDKPPKLSSQAVQKFCSNTLRLFAGIESYWRAPGSYGLRKGSTENSEHSFISMPSLGQVHWRG
jgi:hypothetical protein